MKIGSRTHMKTEKPLLLSFSCFVVVFSLLLFSSPGTQAQTAPWAKEMAAFEAQDQKDPAVGGIVFTGSSSIRLWDLTKSFPGLPVLNRGFGGSQIVESVNHAELLVVRHTPRTVVFYAGDNDLSAGKTPQHVFGDFKAFVSKVHAALPATRIAFIGIKPSIARWAMVAKVRETNALIRDFCDRDDRLGFVDVDGPMLGWDGKPRPDLFVEDGLHLSAKGYALWNTLVLPFLAPPSGVLTSEFIFETAPFASAHASTIIETGGALVAAWFGGTREGADDVGIWLSRQVQGRWSAPVEVATGVQSDGKRHPCWNPVLFEMADTTLTLFYKVGPTPRTWWGMAKTSKDGGRTWSDATRLPDGILGPIKNKPVRLADGTILSPTSTESDTQPSLWRVHFERSRDEGKTWSVVRVPTPASGAIDAIQPSILIHGPRRLQAVGRTRSQRVFETWSDDGGATWGPMALTVLPNPSAGTDAVTLRDGRHLIVYNHTPKGRSPLNVAISRDGKTWDAALVLESEPGEYSYPVVIQTADGRVHVTYTWKRLRIRHVVIDPVQLTSVPMPDGRWPQAVR